MVDVLGGREIRTKALLRTLVEGGLHVDNGVLLEDENTKRNRGIGDDANGYK